MLSALFHHLAELFLCIVGIYFELCGIENLGSRLGSVSAKELAKLIGTLFKQLIVAVSCLIKAFS